MQFNSLVNFFLFVSLSISALLSNTLQMLNFHLMMFLAIIFFLKIKIILLIKSLFKAAFFFISIFFFYLIFTILLSDVELKRILVKVFIGLYKLFLSISIMNVYISFSQKENLIKIFRTILFKLKLNNKFVEDIVLFFTLSVRYFPEIKNNWKSFECGDVYIGLKKYGSFIARIKHYTDIFSRILFLHFKKTSIISRNIKLRGYGNCIPRGVINPVNIKFNHLVISVFIPIVVLIAHFYV